MRLLSLIRPTERRETAAAFVTILLVMAAHALLETTRDTLFLTNLPPSRLPIVYLAIAGLAVLTGPIVGRSGNERINRRTLLALQLVAALGTAAFVPLATSPRQATYYALYMWGGLAAAVVLVRLWLILGERLTASQAKRLFPLIASGAVLGSLAGFAGAGLLAHWHSPQALLTASALTFVASAGASLVWLRAPGQRSDGTAAGCALDEGGAVLGPWRSLELVARHPYVRRIALLLLLASVAVTLCDFIFKSIVSQAIPARRLGSFLASVYFACDLASFVLLLAAVPPVVRAIGVPRALAVRPALLLVGGALLTVAGGLPIALMLRGVDGTLRWSLHKTATELLYVPMAPRLRCAVKEVSDLVAQRGGQAFGSLLILGGLALAPPELWPGLMLSAVAAAWIAVALSVRAPYLNLFRETLSEALIETRLEFPELDLASLETLMAALNSPDDHRVLAALDLLGATGRVHVIPALILYHPSPPVVVRALELFAAARREDLLLLSERLSAHGEPAVRAAAVRAAAAVYPDADGLRRAAESSCPIVSATALIAAAAHGASDPQAALVQVRERLAASDPPADLAPFVARALREFPLPAFAPLLVELTESPDPDTRREVVRAMGALRDPAHLPILIRLLAQRESRDAVRGALLGYGDPALAQLHQVLEDLSAPHAVRVHVPRSIARFGHQRAADLLLRHLLVEPGGMVRYKILRGLGRLSTDVPGRRFDSRLLHQIVDDHLAKTFLLLHWRVVLAEGAAARPQRDTPGHRLLADLLQQKETFAIERLFRSLGLCQPEGDFAQLYDGVRGDDAETHASSRELLEHLVPARWRQAVVGLIDDVADRERLATGSGFYEAEGLGYDDLLRSLIDHPSDVVAALAAYHALEIGLTGVATHADAARQSADDLGGARQRWLDELLRGYGAPAAEVRHVG